MILLLSIFTYSFAADNLPLVSAQAIINDIPAQISRHVLSDGQFVYGPNVGNFNVKTYLQDNSPYLTRYANELYEHSNYFSINPKVYLTLLEVHGYLITHPDATGIENPFGLLDVGFVAQIDHLSQIMSDAYYLHLYSSQSQPLSLFPGDRDASSTTPDINAGTYAIIAALTSIESQRNIDQILDNTQSNGFYQTYRKLFGNDDPLDETNHITIPGESEVLSGLDGSQQPYPSVEVSALTAPTDLLQLPFLRGQSWYFSGVHSNGSSGQQTPYTDASALDFGPGGVAWGGDTSNMWVVASASGIPTKISNCYFSILHSGGWETTYYHIENIQNFSGSINQNDKIGVIANTLAEAICSGGSATGPHVHFNLKHNGALVAIDGTSLSGWYVHAGRWNYDTDPNYMWLEKDGVKKYANINRVLSEASQLPAAITGNVGVGGATLSYIDGTPQSIISQPDGSYSLSVLNNWSGAVTPTHPCYMFSPTSRSYSNVTANEITQDYTPTFNSAAVCAVTVGVFRPSNGLLYLKNSNTTGFADIAINYGMGGDYPVVGDWDGDGTVTIGIYRNGSFYLRNSNTLGFADLVFPFGQVGDQPIAGDWNGDGIDTIGIFRPSNGLFLLRNSNDEGLAEMSFFLGNAGDVGIAGDWTGKGFDTVGVFRPSNGIIFLKNTNQTGFADIALNYGIPGDRPVTGDWNSDGKDTIGVYRNGQFLLRNSNDVGFADYVFGLGNPGDMPIAGNWDALP